jgi:hypothetical protein
MDGKVGSAISEVATEILLVETTRQPPESGNSAFERLFTKPDRNLFLGWNPGPSTIRSYLIADALTDSEFRAVWNANGLVRGTAYLWPDQELSQVAVNEETIIRSSEAGNVVIGCNHIHGNYFHWITQALPAIDHALRRDGQALQVALALPVLDPWQEECLRLLGYDGVKRITLDDATKLFFFRSVEFSELLNGGAAFCLSEAVYRTYSRMRDAVPKIVSTGRRLYVARTDTLRRRVRNEAALVEEMRQRGFEIVVPGGLTVTEQIRLFREASLVVGPHGAGMTNIVFCEPGTIVYELVPDEYRNVCFGNLALICRLRYWADHFESKGDGPPVTRDWDVDMTAIRDRLDEIEAIQAQLRQASDARTISAMDFLRGDPGLLSAGTPRPVAPPPKRGLLSRLFGRRGG